MKKSKIKSKEASRRQALKAVAIASGGVVTAHWSKPVINSVILPAHAQTSPAASAAAAIAGLVAGGGGGGGSSTVTP